MSDRCLQEQEVGEAGDGGGTLAVKEQYSATGEDVPKKTAEAPLMAPAGRGDTGGRRSEGVVEVGCVYVLVGVGGSGTSQLLCCSCQTNSKKCPLRIHFLLSQTRSCSCKCMKTIMRHSNEFFRVVYLFRSSQRSFNVPAIMKPILIWF